MSTAKLNNLKNKGDFILVRFHPSSLKLQLGSSLSLSLTVVYDVNTINQFSILQDFIYRNQNKTIALTYKNICIVGHLLPMHNTTNLNSMAFPLSIKADV